MNINIKVKNMELTSAIKSYIKKKVLSLEKFIHDAPENIQADVEVGKVSHHHKSGDIFRAEARLNFKGKEIYVVAEKDDLYASIDEIRSLAERECTALKDKKLTQIKRGAAKAKKILRGGK
ncbi:MAG: ribosome-associated translation inhibitor RaiA [Parcubacteria group bacterium]|nr:ribosome-associated translation inhibitor RaiA [Parcubacteria group bacterium]